MSEHTTQPAELKIPGVEEPIELPIYSGNLGPDVIDVGKLTSQGYFTYDPGFVSTAACESGITYIDGDDHVFMNMNTYEEERIKTADIDKVEFLKEEATIDVLYWRGKAIDVQIPKTVELKVVEAAPGAKGNTAQGRAEKPCVLETGASLNVPIFIEEGEVVRVDTDERKYLGRVNN